MYYWDLILGFLLSITTHQERTLRKSSQSLVPPSDKGYLYPFHWVRKNPTSLRTKVPGCTSLRMSSWAPMFNLILKVHGDGTAARLPWDNAPQITNLRSLSWSPSQSRSTHSATRSDVVTNEFPQSPTSLAHLKQWCNSCGNISVSRTAVFTC